jgi:hypothetical protein
MNECKIALWIVYLTILYQFFFNNIDNRSIASASMSSLGFGGMDEESVGMASWRERLRYKLENIEVVKASGKTCDIKLGVGSETKIRSLHFSKPRECQSFIKVMEQMKVMEQERAKHKAEEYLSSRQAASSPSSPPMERRSLPQPSTTPIRKSPLNVKRNLYSLFGGGNHNHDPASTNSTATSSTSRALLYSNYTEQQSPSGGDASLAINLLIEIVSASNLPATDIYYTSSDPYIVVREASKEVHRTKVIPST